MIFNSETLANDLKGLPSNVCVKYESKFCGEGKKHLGQ